MRQAIHRFDALRLAIADARVMNDRIEAAKRIRLLRDIARFSDARQIAGHDRFRLRQRAARIVGARSIARVKHDRMTLFGKQLRGHQTESIGRTCDEDTSHVPSSALSVNRIGTHSARIVTASR